MNFTSIEQSKKLLELGLSANTADMVWNVCVDDTARLLPKDDWDATTEGGRILVPCWSVGALLELMPRDLFMATPKRKEKFIIQTCDGWAVFYRQFAVKSIGKVYCWKEEQDLIDACYSMVIWLLENKFIKKG